MTLDAVVKPAPVTVRVNGGLPALTLVGLTFVIVGLVVLTINAVVESANPSGLETRAQ
jgi:hypothetical protein